MQACLCVESTLQRRFSRRGGVVTHVQACLSVSKDGESRFYYCGSPVKLVQACLCAENTLQRPLIRRGGAEARTGLFKCHKRSRKQFSSLWWSCDARASLFREHPTTPL